MGCRDIRGLTGLQLGAVACEGSVERVPTLVVCTCSGLLRVIAGLCGLLRVIADTCAVLT